MILESKQDFDGAREHMQKYLTLEPKASDQVSVRSRMEHLGTTAATDIATELQQVAAQLQLAPSTEAWVPGGMKALAALAGVTLTGAPVTSQDFFAEFCRALVREVSPGLARGIPEYHRGLETFMASIAELGHLGERKDDKTVITLSTAGEEQRKAAARILNLLGWKLTESSGVEPGDQPRTGSARGFRRCSGSMRSTCSRRSSRGAPSSLTSRRKMHGGGRRSVDADDHRGAVARRRHRGGVRAGFPARQDLPGLGAMGGDTAAAVVTGVGLRALVDKYADVLARYSDAFALSKDGAAVPGDEEAWKKLAGVSPHAASAFFRALIERDDGSLAAFHQALSHADAAHQRFFTSTPARAERFYTWYRDSGEPRWSQTVAFRPGGVSHCSRSCR